MYVNQIVWLDYIVDKLESKHSVSTEEVEEILYGKVKVRKIARGDVDGEDLYLALGQTGTGRYLAVFLVLKRNQIVLPISARDMDDKERRLYGRK